MKIQFPISSFIENTYDSVNESIIKVYEFEDKRFIQCDKKFIHFLFKNKIKIYHKKYITYAGKKMNQKINNYVEGYTDYIFFTKDAEFFIIKNSRLKKYKNIIDIPEYRGNLLSIKYGKYRNIGSTHFYIKNKRKYSYLKLCGYV